MHQFVQGCLASISKNLSPKNKTSLIAQAKGVPTILSADGGGGSPVGKRGPSGSQRFSAKRPCDGDRRGVAWSLVDAGFP
jgi:hypothetical protein